MKIMRTIGMLTMALAAAGCAVSPEIQALMDEYERTVPVCSSEQDCQVKWRAARAWAIENSNFPILTENELRIMASSTLSPTRGVGVVVNRDGILAGASLRVEVECFSASSCPNVWEMQIDFNRTVAAASAN
jgi:hypothetical protein